MSKKNKLKKPKKEQVPAIHEKILYTKGEKTAEILSVIYCIISGAVQIALFASGICGTGAIVTGIITLVECAAFTFGSAYPQYTNIYGGKIRTTEQMFRNIRKYSIAIKFVISTILLLLAVFVL